MSISEFYSEENKNLVPKTRIHAYLQIMALVLLRERIVWAKHYQRATESLRKLRLHSTMREYFF